MFLVVSSDTSHAACGQQTSSCPVESRFLKEKTSFEHHSLEIEEQELESPSQTSLEKLDQLVHQDEFKDFLTDLKKQGEESVFKSFLPLQEPLDQGPQPQESRTHPALYIFISFSLGDLALLHLAEEAKEYGATLVLRGLKEGSLRKTIASLQKILLKTSQGVLIDPELFNRFSITTVPTFILSQAKAFDRLCGHVSFIYALETFAREGDLKKAAHDLLQKVRSR